MTLLDVIDLENSEFYVRKQLSWTMGESGLGFGLEFMRKSK